jgi:microcystin-dependent protein
MISFRNCKFKYFLHLGVDVEPFIGEIKLCPFKFVPKGWALCDGSLLPINQNLALYALLGMTYGGEANVNFALPDLRGRTPVHRSNTNPQYLLGAKLGSESVTLTAKQVPSHSHVLNVSNAAGTQMILGSGTNILAAETGARNNTEVAPIYAKAENLIPMAATMCKPQGDGKAHDNMQQSLVLNYIIAIEGFFPPRE